MRDDLRSLKRPVAHSIRTVLGSGHLRRAVTLMHDQWPDDRFRELTRDLLDAVANDELADVIVQHVLLRTSGESSDRLSIVRAMPAGVRAIYTTWLVDAEVCNGGFNQLFWNPSGELGGDALAGY